MRSFSYLVVGAVVAFARLGDARAAQGGSPDDAAKAALDEASRAEASDRPTLAIESLKRAYELNGDTELLFRLGELTRKIGQEIPAMRFYRAYLTRDPRGKHRAAAEREVHLLEASVGDPDRGAPPGTARSAPTAAPPATGRSPDGKQANQGRPTGLVPESLALETSAATGARTAPQVDLRADAAPSANEVAPPLPRWLPWVGVAATIALGTGAAVSGLAASHRYDELRSSCGATATGCSGTQIDDVRARARTANLLWAGTGIAAAAAGVAIYVNTREAGLSGLWRF